MSWRLTDTEIEEVLIREGFGLVSGGRVVANAQLLKVLAWLKEHPNWHGGTLSKLLEAEMEKEVL